MLVVVAVEAQQLPVAAVGRIEFVVVIAVVDGQLMPGGVVELARAAAADPRLHLHRLLAVAEVALVGGSYRVGDDAVEAGVVGDLCLLQNEMSRFFRWPAPRRQVISNPS